MKLDLLDATAALGIVAAEFHFEQPPQALRAAIICEHIRAIVQMGTSQEGGQGVSGFRAERIACQRIAPLLKCGDDDLRLAKEVKLEVRNLVRLRDLVETSAGLVVSPPRLVPLDECTSLLIGGGPIQSLPSEIRSTLRIGGRARIVSLGLQNKKFFGSLPLQSPLDWLSAAVTDQVAWREALISEARKKMVAVDDIEHLEVLENGFWSKLGKGGRFQDLSLIRYKQGPFARHAYALASVTVGADGIPKVSRAFNLDYDDARRFQGYSPTDGRQASLQFVRTGDFVEVAVGHPLARPESRFLSLGWFALCKPPYEWPRHYWFAVPLLPLLRVAATSLGFALTEVSTLGKKNEKR